MFRTPEFGQASAPLAWLDATSVASSIDTVRETIRLGMPHIVCRACAGRGGTEESDCRLCRANGYLPESAWNSLDAEQIESAENWLPGRQRPIAGEPRCLRHL